MADPGYMRKHEPKHPRLEVIGEFLKTVSESSALGKFLLEGKADLLRKIAYGDRLYKGKGHTFQLDPLVTEIPDLVPGPGTLAKGAKMASVIGPVGIRNLKDETLTKAYEKLVDVLRKTNPRDWKLQKEIVEDADPNFVPIPRGRDFTSAGQLPATIKFGYEIPEGKTTDLLRTEVFEGSEEGRANLARLAKDFEEFTGKKLRRQPGIMGKDLHFREAYDAPRLLRAYPSLGRIKIGGQPGPIGGASYSAGQRINLFPQDDPKWLEEIFPHEIQHHIQSIEGWPGGTNEFAARLVLNQTKKRLEDIALRSGSAPLPRDLELYRKLASKQADLLRNMGGPSSGKAANEMYMREAGEQLAVAAASSHVGKTKNIAQGYSTPYSHMWDQRNFPIYVVDE